MSRWIGVGLLYQEAKFYPLHYEYKISVYTQIMGSIYRFENSLLQLVAMKKISKSQIPSLEKLRLNFGGKILLSDTILQLFGR